MSIFQQALSVITSDLKASAEAWMGRIVNANLPHLDYTVAQTTYRVLSEVNGLIEQATKFANENPDSAVPETFLPAPQAAPLSDEEAAAADAENANVSTTVDIASGEISQSSSAA